MRKQTIERTLLWILIPTVLATFIWQYFGMFLGFGVMIIGAILLIIPSVILLLITLIFLVINKFQSKKLAFVWALGIILPILGMTIEVDKRIYYYWHHNTLNTFAADILSDRKIYAMSDCQRYSKDVNQYYASESDSIDWHHYFVSALASDGISSERFDRYLAYMQETKLISFGIENNYILFCYDGFLSDEFGLLYLIDGEPPEVGKEIEWGKLSNLEHISGKWYYYWET